MLLALRICCRRRIQRHRTDLRVIAPGVLVQGATYGRADGGVLSLVTKRARQLLVGSSLTRSQARLEAGMKSLLLFRRALSSPTMCRFIPALSVPEDPGVFSDQFSFGRSLAPINGGKPKGQCGVNLVAAADWLTRALDLQGYRLDDVEGVSTEFVPRLLSEESMRGKFAVGEFADQDVSLLENWANATGHRASCFDFPLHFALKDMCNTPDQFSMASLDHFGLVGIDPLGAVTFVENHDTDSGNIGGPVVTNKLLGYAYILTSEGYPCVFYREYSKDPNCFGLQDEIDLLISIHERVAEGPTQQRFKDDGVFVYERMGGHHLLVGLNKDTAAPVQTGFAPNQELQNLVDDKEPRIKTNGGAQVTLTIPRNTGGQGYVCYGVPIKIDAPFERAPITTTQIYQGARDLDIKPAIPAQTVQPCRIFTKNGSTVSLRLDADTSHWTDATAITVAIRDPEGSDLGSKTFNQGNQGSTFAVRTTEPGFHSIVLDASNTPQQNNTPSFGLGVTYGAPQTLQG